MRYNTFSRIQPMTWLNEETEEMINYNDEWSFFSTRSRSTVHEKRDLLLNIESNNIDDALNSQQFLPR